MANSNEDYLRRLVAQLAKLPKECEWVEFKENKADPEDIGGYISALSNAATLCGKPKAYLVWGVNDETHVIVGTKFKYAETKVGNQDLELWLAQMTNPKLDFHFDEFAMEDGTPVTVLEIPAAMKEPTKHKTVAYVRIGSSKSPLHKHPDKEAALWRLLDTTPAEMRIAAEDVTEDEVLELLDYPGYYRILGQHIPASRDKVVKDLEDEGFILATDAGSWDITNLGALMIASDLSKFGTLAKKAVRVIQYKEKSRVEGVQERVFAKGYALSHEEIVQFVMAVIPQEEILDGVIRRQVTSFPEVAIRELEANMTIHQAIDQRGTSPMVEVFSNRIEFANAGAPLVAIDRIVDTVPKSRNDRMAGFMHKCGICEERGSGYDKIIGATCAASIVAPRIEDQEGTFTKVVLFSKMPFDTMTKDDRMRTCYMRACLASVNYEAISNQDIRQLFDIPSDDKYKASRIIKDTLTAGLIKPVDPNTAPRYMRYVPYWA